MGVAIRKNSLNRLLGGEDNEEKAEEHRYRKQYTTGTALHLAFFFTLQYILEIFPYQFLQIHLVPFYCGAALHCADVPPLTNSLLVNAWVDSHLWLLHYHREEPCACTEHTHGCVCIQMPGSGVARSKGKFL